LRSLGGKWGDVGFFGHVSFSKPSTSFCNRKTKYEMFYWSILQVQMETKDVSGNPGLVSLGTSKDIDVAFVLDLSE
jgi:hypothetical protein